MTSFHKSLAINVIVQSVGSGLSLLLAVGIAVAWGTKPQGEFALIKSWLDFASLLALAGLPQGFVYVINRMGIRPTTLIRISNTYCTALLPLGVIGAAMTIRLGYLPELPFLAGAVILGFSLAASSYHGLIRSILLTRNDGLTFSLFSIAPTVALFMGVFGFYGVSAPDFLLSFLISSAVAVIISAASGLRLRQDQQDVNQAVEWRTIAKLSLHSFIVSVFASAQIVVLYSAMRLLGAEINEVGTTSVALLVVNAVNVLCTMISPVLYNRWSGSDDSGSSGRLVRQIAAASVGLSVLIGAATAVGIAALSLIGAAIVTHVAEPLLILCGALPAVLFTRLIIPALFAAGQPAAITIASVVRVALLPFMIMVVHWSGLEIVIAAVTAFVAVEWTGAVIALAAIKLFDRRNAANLSTQGNAL